MSATATRLRRWGSVMGAIGTVSEPYIIMSFEVTYE